MKTTITRFTINNPRRKDNGMEAFRVQDETGRIIFTCHVDDPDEVIRENAMFEIDYDSKELRSEIAELIISMK